MCEQSIKKKKKKKKKKKSGGGVLVGRAYIKQSEVKYLQSKYTVGIYTKSNLDLPEQGAQEIGG